MTKTLRDRWFNVGATIFILLAIASGLLFSVLAFSAARKAAKQSAQYALFREIVIELEKHKKVRGQYPNQLRELNLTYPDGGDPSLLELFQYETDGLTFTLSSFGVATKAHLTAHSTDGEPFMDFGTTLDVK